MKTNITKLINIYLLGGLLISGTVFSFGSCDDSFIEKIADERITMKEIQINTTAELPLLIGKDSLLTISIRPDSLSNKTLQWSSENAEVATVSSDGRVKAIGLGTTKIIVKATDGSARTGSITVKVIDKIIYVDDIIVNGPTNELFENQKLQLTAVVNPVTATYKTLKWSSSDNKIATVSQNGEVSTLGQGTVLITASSTDGGGKSKSFTLKVNKITQAENITIDQLPPTLGFSQVYMLKYTLSPFNATEETVSWTSDKPNIVAVDNRGLLTAKGFGTAIITATINKTNVNVSIPVEVAYGRIFQDFTSGVNNYLTPSGSNGVSLTAAGNSLLVKGILDGGNKYWSNFKAYKVYEQWQNQAIVEYFAPVKNPIIAVKLDAYSNMDFKMDPHCINSSGATVYPGGAFDNRITNVPNLSTNPGFKTEIRYIDLRKSLPSDLRNMDLIRLKNFYFNVYVYSTTVGATYNLYWIKSFSSVEELEGHLSD